MAKKSLKTEKAKEYFNSLRDALEGIKDAILGMEEVLDEVIEELEESEK
jgi:hypothetical protein